MLEREPYTIKDNLSELTVMHYEACPKDCVLPKGSPAGLPEMIDIDCSREGE
jgi:hypothetical protein